MNITMRRGSNFSDPIIDNAKKSYVRIKNVSGRCYFLKKNTHVADIRICEPTDMKLEDDDKCRTLKIYDIDREEVSHFTPQINTFRT